MARASRRLSPERIHTTLQINQDTVAPVAGPYRAVQAGQVLPFHGAGAPASQALVILFSHRVGRRPEEK
jgi:hypothetical protein